MNELQSVGVGVALGLVVVSVLTLYPGEPFDYTTDRGDAGKSDSFPPTRCSDDPLSIKKSSVTEEGEQLADIERAARRVKIQKLQELLGLEKEKAQRLVQRAKKEAMDPAKTPGQVMPSSFSNSCKSAWLDRGFFFIMFGLLMWVLWQDYNINLFSIAAYLLPREAEMIHQVTAAPRDLVSLLLELW